MIGTDIVNEIAHLISQRDIKPKDSKGVKEVRVKTAISQPHDAVELSRTATAYAHAAGSTAEYEKEQGMKVEHIKSLVNAGNYTMDQKTIETIAERITNMLL